MRFICLLFVLALPAHATLFGLPASPCGIPGLHYDAQNNICKYCRRGQEMVGESRCLYNPRLGSRCDKGDNAYLDPASGLCLVCPSGKFLITKEKRYR